MEFFSPAPAMTKIYNNSEETVPCINLPVDTVINDRERWGQGQERDTSWRI